MHRAAQFAKSAFSGVILKKRTTFVLLWLFTFLLTGWQPTSNLSLSTPPSAALAIGVHTIQGDAREAALAHAAGFDTIVQLFHWGEIEPTRGQFYWQRSDELVQAAAYYGLNLIVRLDHPPDWARPALLQPGASPVQLAAYETWVRRVVDRYRGQVYAYIIWNEPNLALEWGGLSPDPATYVDLLAVGYRAVKTADPNALVVSAGLAPTNTRNAQALDDRLYLEAMYAAGASAYFDVLGVHAYGFGLPPDEPRDGGWDGGLVGLVFARVEVLHEIMAVYGDGEKPLWITEMGWTVEAQAHSAWHAVTLIEQAEYLVRTLEKSQEEWPWLERITVWNLGGERNSEWRGYSLLDEEGEARPAYHALNEYMAPTVALRRKPRQSVSQEQIQILAADSTIHLGDANLPAPWVPLHQGRNPSPLWEGTFYVVDPGQSAWQLTMRTMQSNYWGNRIWINDQPLAQPVAIDNFTKSWVAQTWMVPAKLLQAGPNQIRVTIAHAVPLIQDKRFGYDKLQIKDIVLRRSEERP